MTYRSGLVSVVGRPNTGKSTLVNALTGEKVAITSSRPQTTRHVIRGVVHRPTGQLVLVDTPGLHKPRTLLGQRLNDEVRHALTDVDVVAVTLPANESIGPGDRRVTAEAAAMKRFSEGRGRDQDRSGVSVTSCLCIWRPSRRWLSRTASPGTKLSRSRRAPETRWTCSPTC